MNTLPRRLRWTAFGLAAWLGIGGAVLQLVLADDCPPAHAPTRSDNDADWEIDPRRPC